MSSGSRADHRQARSSGPQGSVRLASVPWLQSLDGPTRRRGGCPLRERSLHRRAQRRTRTQRGLLFGLWAPLGPTALLGMERLRPALDKSGPVARGETWALTDDRMRPDVFSATGWRG